jgi:hypothetical protein
MDLADTTPGALSRLIYVSSSGHPMDDEALLELLETSRESNRKRDITGLLLYKDGNWLQVLEGPAEQVHDVFSRIRRDPRHHDVTVVSEDRIDARLFSDWAMGFRKLSDPDLLRHEGYSAFMNRAYDGQRFRRDPTGCLDILRYFRDG